MRARPMISMGATMGLLEAIEAAGGDPDQILPPFGLDRSVFAKTDGFIPCSIFAGILKETARATGDDCFGLHFAERFNPKDIGPLAYVALNSPTIAASIQNVERYLHVYDSSAQWFFTAEGERGYIRFVLTGLHAEELRQSNEHGMTTVLNTLRMMFGSQWAPLEVQFAHAAPEEALEHQRIFRAPVLFGYETNALVIERGLTEREVPAADQQLYRIMKQYLDQVLSEIPREDSDNTLTQIAFLLGYSELSAFNRAFKRWTGSTPLDYRRGAVSKIRNVERPDIL